MLMNLDDARSLEKQYSAQIFVDTPPVHQGVADALRSAFTPTRDNLPSDLAALLNQLD